MFWLLLVSSVFAGCIDGEIIFVQDATPERGLSQTLTFYVKRGQQNVKLSLQENNREHQSTALTSQQNLVSKSYNDYVNGGSFEVSLTKQNTGRYLRTLTGNFNLNGELVHIKPALVSGTQWSRANPWIPYILLSNEEMELSVPDSIEKRRRCKDSFKDCKKWLINFYQNNLKNFCGRDMYERWCCDTCRNWDVAPVQCKDDLRNDCREMLQESYNNDYDTFCPTWDDNCCATCSRKPGGKCVDKGHLGKTCQELLDWAVHGDMEKMCLHYNRECCAMCSERHILDHREEIPVSQLPNGPMSFPTIGILAHEEQPDASGATIEKRRRCKDSFKDCKKWLNNFYQNNLKNFCGRDMYERWCCDTCRNWDVAPVQCKDDLRNDCREMLQDRYNNDYDTFCPTWDDNCCATCSRKPGSKCVDKGHLGKSCQELLDWAVHGDMEKMCLHYNMECCAMCSEH